MPRLIYFVPCFTSIVLHASRRSYVVNDGTEHDNYSGSEQWNALTCVHLHGCYGIELRACCDTCVRTETRSRRTPWKVVEKQPLYEDEQLLHFTSEIQYSHVQKAASPFMAEKTSVCGVEKWEALLGLEWVQGIPNDLPILTSCSPQSSVSDGSTPITLQQELHSIKHRIKHWGQAFAACKGVEEPE